MKRHNLVTEHSPSFGCALNMDLWSTKDLLGQARLAEKEGFDRLWVSDHFHPWLHQKAHEGFAWVFIASAACKTRKIVIGTCVTAPILRYHPAIVAQAFATLEKMYPKRIFLGLGLGEAMNEVPLGYDWPPFKERLKRFEEATEIIRLLWKKNFVKYEGTYYKLNEANLYNKPAFSIPICIASNGLITTKLAGKYADSYLTHPFNERRIKKLFTSLQKGAEEAGRNPELIEKCLQFACSFDEDYNKAVLGVSRVAANLIPGILEKNISDPRKIEELGKMVDKEKYSELFTITTDPETLITNVEKYIKLGFSHINFINFGPDQMKFIKICGKYVIPALKDVL